MRSAWKSKASSIDYLAWGVRLPNAQRLRPRHIVPTEARRINYGAECKSRKLMAKGLIAIRSVAAAPVGLQELLLKIFEELVEFAEEPVEICQRVSLAVRSEVGSRARAPGDQRFGWLRRN